MGICIVALLWLTHPFRVKLNIDATATVIAIRKCFVFEIFKIIIYRK
jgi:hypothetical protein